MNIPTSFSSVILFACFVGLSLQASSQAGSDSPPKKASPKSQSMSSLPHRERPEINLYNDPPYMSSSPRSPTRVRDPSPEHKGKEKNTEHGVSSSKSTKQMKNKEEENQLNAKRKAKANLQKKMNRVKDAESSDKVSNEEVHRFNAKRKAKSYSRGKVVRSK